MSIATSSSPSSTDVTSNEGGIRLLTLQSNDGHIFEVKQSVGMQSILLRGMVEGSCADSTIPLYNVTGEVLARVIEWWNMHEIGKLPDEELKEWESHFIYTEGDQNRLSELYDLLMAAHYLNVPALMNCCCKEVAVNLTRKLPVESRNLFKIRNDFSAEEEEQIAQENQWIVYP